jgi:DNA repair ATPase RecN
MNPAVISALLVAADAALNALVFAALEFQADLEKYNKEKVTADDNLKKAKNTAECNAQVDFYQKKLAETEKIYGEVAQVRMEGQSLSQQLDAQSKIDQAKEALKTAEKAALNSPEYKQALQQAESLIKPVFKPLGSAKAKVKAAAATVATAAAVTAVIGNSKADKCGSDDEPPSQQTLSIIENTIENI